MSAPGILQNGMMSGVDMERRVFLLCRLGSKMDGDDLERDASLSRKYAIEESLTAELIDLWQEVAAVNAERIRAFHDFAWPADERFIALQPGKPAGVPYPDAPLLKPWIDLVRLHDRDTLASTSLADTGLIPRVSADTFNRSSGLRWMYDSDLLWLSPSSTRELRLFYVPAPTPVSIDSPAVRVDIPIELHRVLCYGAAVRVAIEHGLTHLPKLEQMYERGLARALASLSVDVQDAEYATYTREGTLNHSYAEQPYGETW